jgi:hypothetical protein
MAARDDIMIAVECALIRGSTVFSCDQSITERYPSVCDQAGVTTSSDARAVSVCARQPITYSYPHQASEAA